MLKQTAEQPLDSLLAAKAALNLNSSPTPHHGWGAKCIVTALGPRCRSTPAAMPGLRPALIDFQRAAESLKQKIHYIMYGKSDIFFIMQLLTLS